MSTETHPVSSNDTKFEEEKLDFKIIIVRLSFPGYDPFYFKFRRQLNRELVNMKDKFYDLSEDEQKEQLHAQKVRMLSKLLKEHVNIPGWDETKTPEDSFFEYFTEDIETINWLWTRYQNKLYPKEVIATPSE